MIIYDIEIKRAIPDYRNPQVSDVEYCGGWEDFSGMGIAVIGVWDYSREQPRVFCDDNLAKFRQLVERTDIVCGFNNARFDNKVLEAHNIVIPREKSYDLLREIYRGLNLLNQLDTNGFSAPHKGYSLDAMVQANFGVGKAGHGANAPINWQRGKVGDVIDYCLADVMLTRKLLDRVIRNGELLNPKVKGDKIRVRRPVPEV